MVERYRHRTRGKQKLLSNHQRCWIWGRHLVLETLHAGRWPIVELHIADTLSNAQLETVNELAADRDIRVCVESPAALTKSCRSKEHQGYLAKMRPFPYSPLSEILGKRIALPLFVLLDSIQDPHNFGAILRSADVLRVDAVFVELERQSEVTSQVARSSAGAVNYVPIVQVMDLVELARELQSSGLELIAATPTAKCPLFDFDFSNPCATILGNESLGIREPLLAICDQQVCIPQVGNLESLNAAISAGILFYEIMRQRQGQTGGGGGS